MSHISGGSLLIIDQESIRHEATEDLQDAYDSMRRMRQQVEDFEAVDRPAFSRWLRSEFHDQLAEISRLQTKVVENEELVAEIQMIRLATGCSFYQAYVNAMERRRLGEKFKDFAGSSGFFDEDDEDDDGVNVGHDEDSTEKGQKQRRDGKNKKGRKGSAADDALDDDNDAFNASEDSRSHADEFEGSDSAHEHEKEGLFDRVRRAARGTADMIKQRYRELARILHPDLRSGGDAWTNELWHRTQTAYASRNLDELENLLVLCRVSFQESAETSSVSDLRAALAFLRKSVVALRRQIASLRQDMAWGFSRLKDKSRLRRRISYDLDFEHEELTVRLDTLEGQLARWSVPPAPRRGQGQRRSHSQTRRSSRSSSSWDLDF